MTSTGTHIQMIKKRKLKPNYSCMIEGGTHLCLNERTINITAVEIGVAADNM